MDKSWLLPPIDDPAGPDGAAYLVHAMGAFGGPRTPGFGSLDAAVPHPNANIVTAAVGHAIFAKFRIDLQAMREPKLISARGGHHSTRQMTFGAGARGPSRHANSIRVTGRARSAPRAEARAG